MRGKPGVTAALCVSSSVVLAAAALAAASVEFGVTPGAACSAKLTVRALLRPFRCVGAAADMAIAASGVLQRQRKHEASARAGK